MATDEHAFRRVRRNDGSIGKKERNQIVNPAILPILK
jgi:hypothetical protein